MSATNPYQAPATINEKADPIETHLYRGRFWPVYWVAAATSWTVGVSICWLMGMPPDTPLAWGMSGLWTVLSCLGFTGFLTAFFTVRVSETEIYCYDFWGVYHRVPWEAIQTGRPINLLGLRYLRLIAPGHPTLWTPLYLHRMNDFERTVSRWTHVFAASRSANR